MALNIDKFKKDLEDLNYRGLLLECSMIRSIHGEEYLRGAMKGYDKKKQDSIIKDIPVFNSAYEKWYSEGLAVLKQLLPDRVADFRERYEKPKNRKDVKYGNYVIQDYIIGHSVTRYGDEIVGPSAAIPQLQHQNAILSAAEARFTSSLFEIKQIVQADLFDSEIESAKELLKHKFVRAAGAIAGVVLEKHLTQVCIDHNIKIIKKNPGISDLNEMLKSSQVIDITQWRHITFLADIRNICDHNKQKEPTVDQVNDLVDGTDKVLKTVA